MRGLTKPQGACLDALRRHGQWHPGAGWVWDNASSTVRILDALVKKGYAYTEASTWRDRHGKSCTIYKPREI